MMRLTCASRHDGWRQVLTPAARPSLGLLAARRDIINSRARQGRPTYASSGATPSNSRGLGDDRSVDPSISSSSRSEASDEQQRQRGGVALGADDRGGRAAEPRWPSRRETCALLTALGGGQLGLVGPASGIGFDTDISLTASPESAAVGEEVTLSFAIQGNGVPLGVDSLEAYSLFGVKPHKVHVKIYDQDLDGIEIGHVHPEEFPGGMRSEKSGQYVVKFAFPNEGNFNVTLQCAPSEIVRVTKSVPQAIVLAEFPFQIS